LNQGDLAVVAARPRIGKTSFVMGLFVQAIQKKVARNFYFSLSENHRDVAGRISNYDESIGHDNPYISLDYSNDINADYIISKINNEVSKGSLIIVDYLQLLDEKRTNPPLQLQIEKLKSFAKEKGVIIVFLSQVKREVEERPEKKLSEEDLRLPNPLDLKLINKFFLLYKNKMGLREVSFSNDNKLVLNWNETKQKFE
jgi:replicative DNA helicase